MNTGFLLLPGARCFEKRFCKHVAVWEKYTSYANRGIFKYFIKLLIVFFDLRKFTEIITYFVIAHLFHMTD